MVGWEIQASLLGLGLSSIFSEMLILVSTMGDEPYFVHIEKTSKLKLGGPAGKAYMLG